MMRLKNKFLPGLFLVIILAIFQSCATKSESNPEFIADDNTFKDFMTWTLEKTYQGADPALSDAHLGNDSTVTREVYFKNGQDPQNGNYPTGTLIVKHTHNPGGTVNEYTAMAKRGNSFAPSGNDWEWFVLNSDGSIAVDGNNNKLRGGNLLNGYCVNCHVYAKDQDYVFSKP